MIIEGTELNFRENNSHIARARFVVVRVWSIGHRILKLSRLVGVPSRHIDVCIDSFAGLFSYGC